MVAARRRLRVSQVPRRPREPPFGTEAFEDHCERMARTFDKDSDDTAIIWRERAADSRRVRLANARARDKTVSV